MTNFKSYFLLLCYLAITACSSNSLEQKGTIIGRVYSENKSMPIENAQVTISPVNQQSITDRNGWYSLSEIPWGQYTITITKENYAQHTGHISIQSETPTIYDVVLHSALVISDASGKAVTELDYGESLSSISCIVQNMSNETMRCYAESKQPWIHIEDFSIQLQAFGSQTIIVSIDRTKLQGGYNSGDITISAGSITKSIIINAYCEIIKPTVQTLPMSSHYGTGGGWVDTFNGRVVNEGSPSYQQKGFCLSSTNKEPTISDTILGVTRNDGNKDFSFYALEFFANHLYRETYYARAWIMYGENQYEYGDVIEFVFYNMPY